MLKILDKLKQSSENDKIIYKNVLGAFIVKGGALFVSLFTLPSFIRFFNNDEVLGLWYTIPSLLNWILNFDLGIGNGLRNQLSSALSLNEKDNVRKLISSAYFSVALIILLLILVFVFISGFINFNSLLNISDEIVSKESLYKSVLIIFIGCMIHFWLKLINSILYALQKSSINNFLILITNTLILIFVRIFPSQENDKNIIVMAIAYSIAVDLPLIIASIVVFLGKLKYAIPRLSFVTKGHSKDVLSLGGVFFLIQIAYMLIMSTNEFLITITIGNSFVVDYQAYYKLFSIGSTVFALALTPLWSVITKAKAERNNLWIYKTYKRFLYLSIVFCLLEFLVLALMKPIMYVWLGQEFNDGANYLDGFLFAILGCEMIVNSVFSAIVNGLGKLKIQAVFFIIGAVIKIPLAFILVNVLNSWIGVVLSNIISISLYCIVQPCFIKKYLFNKNDN